MGSAHYLDYIAAVHVLSTEAETSQHAVQDVFRRLEEIGGPRTMPIHPRGSAQVSNTPFRLCKSFTHAGGRQVPCIVSWPSALADLGSLRSQYAHVTDVLPTVLDMIGLKSPAGRKGRPAVPVSGVSFLSVLRNGDVPSEHHEQYFERKGNLAYYQKGWEIVARGGPHPGLEQPAWELITSRRIQPRPAISLAPIRIASQSWPNPGSGPCGGTRCSRSMTTPVSGGPFETPHPQATGTGRSSYTQERQR